MSAETLPDPTRRTSLPEDDLETRTITWPTVLGSISIIYAVLALVANSCGTASIFLGDFGLQLAGIDVDGGLDFPAWITVSTVVTGVMGLVLAVLLLVGAIGLIRRRAGSVRILKAWVVLVLCATVIQIGLGYFTIDNNVDLQVRIQDATSEMIREANPKISAQELDEMGLGKSADEIRTASIRNTLLLGSIPALYPIILGFLLTSKGRVSEVDAWD